MDKLYNNSNEKQKNNKMNCDQSKQHRIEHSGVCFIILQLVGICKSETANI